MDCSFKLSFEFVSTLKVLCVELGIAVLIQNIGEGIFGQSEQMDV